MSNKRVVYMAGGAKALNPYLLMCIWPYLYSYYENIKKKTRHLWCLWFSRNL